MIFTSAYFTLIIPLAVFYRNLSQLQKIVPLDNVPVGSLRTKCSIVAVSLTRHACTCLVLSEVLPCQLCRQLQKAAVHYVLSSYYSRSNWLKYTVNMHALLPWPAACDMPFFTCTIMQGMCSTAMVMFFLLSVWMSLYLTFDWHKELVKHITYQPPSRQTTPLAPPEEE